MKLPLHNTKIVATIGPASESPEMLERLVRAETMATMVGHALEALRRASVTAALSVAGPSEHDPQANHRIEFPRTGGLP